MAGVSTGSDVIKNTIKNVQNAVSSMDTTKKDLQLKYQVTSSQWKDHKAKELGALVQECVNTLNKSMKELLYAEKYLCSILSSVQEYENVRFGPGSHGVPNRAAGAPGNGHAAVALSKTRQTFERVMLSGRNVTIFDHPFEANSGRICNQGSAFPNGPQQTCGCCASATIANMNGGNSTEFSMTSYALAHGLCDSEGRTTPQSWIGLLNGVNIPADNTSGESLASLAASVEAGHGVIIGVDARAYNPQWYQSPGGHALVVQSVIRDANSGQILEYVVADSNGGDSVEASVRVDAGVLQRAYSRFGSLSVTTTNIIW